MTPPDPKAKPASDPNSIWGGRFAGGPAEVMERINASIDFDKRLFAQDIAGSKAHAAMLVRQGILSETDGAAIARGSRSMPPEMRHAARKLSIIGRMRARPRDDARSVFGSNTPTAWPAKASSETPFFLHISRTSTSY